MEKEFKKFICGSNMGWLILAFLMGGLIITFLICMFMGNDVAYEGPAFFVTGLLLSLFVMWRKQKRFSSIKADAALYRRMKTDFETSLCIEESVRMGEKWIFFGNCREDRAFLQYDEIEWVYQHVNRTKVGVSVEEKARALYCVDRNGKQYFLCHLEPYDKSQDKLLRIASHIKEKNPAVQII